MRYALIPCLVGFGLLVAACGPSSSDDDDDDNGGESGAGTGGGGGSSGKGGSGGTAGKGGTGGSSGTGGGAMAGAAGGMALIATGPRPFPQSIKPPYCELTSVANAATATQSAYTFWKSAFLVSAGTGLRVQRPDQANDTVSEGVAYGMLMAVYLNDRPTFDGIWTYVKQHMGPTGLMNWRINADGTVASGGMGSATDADEDMAWALVMASVQWSSTTYLGDGVKMARAIMSNEIAGDGMLKAGDSWGSADRTYPDYFSPAFFRVFARADVAGQKANWDIVINRNYEILEKVSGQYGLVPDYTTGGGDLTQAYKYDACRTPWRIAMDYCWNGEPRAKAYLDKIAPFFEGQGVANIGDGYSLTGMKTSNYGNMAFIGPAGVAGMAGYPKLLNDAFTYGASGTGGSTLYYQQSLRVITMLMMSGNFVDFTQQ